MNTAAEKIAALENELAAEKATTAKLTAAEKTAAIEANHSTADLIRSL